MRTSSRTRFAPGVVLPAVLLLLAGCASSGQARVEATDASARKADTIDEEEIDRRPVNSVQELLRGRVAGVQVYEAPGGGIAVRIRGVSSIQGSNEPLYVVDGMPYQPGPGGRIDIHPRDIERIEVLKNASATSMYGMRGANGVIVITTKRPGQ